MPPLTAAEEERLLHVLETQVVGPAAQRAMRGYLDVFTEAVLAAVADNAPLAGTVAAAASPLPEMPGGGHSWPTVGEASSWWAAQVDTHVTQSISEAWRRTYLAQDGLDAIDKTSQDALADYISKVRDRLVRGLEPPVYADSFDKVRQAVADAEAAGWSRTRLADSIATRLDWSPSRAALQREWDDLGAHIDQLLDAYGPPGNPVREMVKESSPRVRTLRQARSRARLRMDADESWWRVRAQRIARTEATGAHAYGRLQALRDTGETHKQWNSAHDERTRPAHAAADGQVVEVDKPFTVGGVPMQMPCDPTAPAGLVVNCRCFLTHAEPPEDWRPADESPEDAAVREAAEKAAAAEARLQKRWRGKAAPKKPTMAKPVKPQPGIPPPEAFDGWLEKVRERYRVFSGGKALEDSNNWPYVEKAIAGGTPGSALDAAMYLVQNKYIDQALWMEYNAIRDAFFTVSPERMAAYRKARASWKRKIARYEKNLADWRRVNGIVNRLSGMEGGLVFDSERAGARWANAHLSKYAQTGEGARALRDYTGQSYRAWNRALREGKGSVPPDWRAETKALDELFANSKPLEHDLYLFRGSSLRDVEFPGGIRTGSIPPPDVSSLVGTVQTYYAYTSTSVGRSAAFSGDLTFVFKVPKGTRVVNAMHVSRFGEEEREILLPRGTRFYVHKVSKKKNGHGWVVEGEVVPDDFDASAASTETQNPLPEKVGDYAPWRLWAW